VRRCAEVFWLPDYTLARRGGNVSTENREKGPTLEVMVNVDPVAMKKRFDPATDLTLIDPSLK
jgi:hypothetical protein